MKVGLRPLLLLVALGVMAGAEAGLTEKSPEGAKVTAQRPGGAPGPAFCAAPPAPGKAGFRFASHHGTSRIERPLRQPGEPAARALPDTIDALAIRVDFADHPMDSSKVYFDRVFFFVGQYWNQATYGKLVVRTTVTDSVYRLPQTEAYYGDDELIEERQTLFIRDAILAADLDHNLAAYDAHMCVHAGNGQEADVTGDSPEQLWSSFATLDFLKAFLPDSTAGQGIPTNDLTPGGEPYFVEFALVLPEVESQDYDPRCTPLPCPYVFGMVGVCSHEFGHALGLPDLYDTTPADFADSQGIGVFDIMSHGTWNNAGFVPARPCAWSLFDLGAIDAELITRPGRFELPAVDGSGGSPPRLAAIPLGGDEYFLLENRVQDPNGNGTFDFNDIDGDSLFSFYIDDYQGAEFDYFLFPPGCSTGSGIYIWHIDPSTIAANGPDNTVEGDPAHKGIDLEEADGVQDLDGFPEFICTSFGGAEDIFRAGNRVRFGPETTPGTHSSFDVPTFVAIDSVSAADSVMSFVVSFDRRKAGAWPVVLPGPVGGNHPAVAELTGGAGLEMVVVDTTGGVWVIGGDGDQPLGPGPLGRVGPDASTSPAIGDIDGDAGLEIVVAGADGTIYAWNGDDGSEVLDGDNNPATLGVWARVGRSLRGAIPVLAPISGPGLAVVIGTPIGPSGTGEVIWCQQLGPAVGLARAEVPGAVTAPPLVFAGVEPMILAPVSAQGRTRFFAIHADDQAVVELGLGRPERQGVVRAQVAGDLDGDGFLEVVASDDRGRVDAWTTDVPRDSTSFVLDELRPLFGWPLELRRNATHDLALGDIDEDGRVEVLLSALDGRLLAINFNGTPQLFFPGLIGEPDRPLPQVVPPPLAIDLAGGPLPEIVFAPGDGRAFAIDGQGHAVRGWPLPGPAAKGAVPVIADLDGDGQLDLVVPSDFASGSVLVAYELGVAEGPGSTWPAYRRGPDHRGIFDAEPLNAAPQSFLREVFVYPNPVVGSDATIHFSLGADARVELQILDATGRVVARPQAPDPAAGRTDHEVRWSVREAASGVYLLRLVARSQGQEAIEWRPFAVTR